jgi:hypothetical protein
VLGEFFAARPEDLDDELIDHGPFERLRTVEAKGLSSITIATLGEILGAGSYDDLEQRSAEGPEGGTNEDAGVFGVPTEIRDALAAADDLTAVAEEWVATEEMARDEWQQQEALEVLRELAELARQARADSCELWYWWSL